MRNKLEGQEQKEFCECVTLRGALCWWCGVGESLLKKEEDSTSKRLGIPSYRREKEEKHKKRADKKRPPHLEKADAIYCNLLLVSGHVVGCDIYG